MWYTVYWDFFWAAVLYTITGVAVGLAKEEDSLGVYILVIPPALFTGAGASMFTLSAILRGVEIL